MSLISRIISVCERKSELVDRVYQNLAFGLVAFATTAIMLNRAVGYRNLSQLSLFAILGLFVIPFILNFRIDRLSEGNAYGLYYAYAILYGAAFAAPLYMYSLTQITIALGMTSVMFLLALYGARYMNIQETDLKFFSVGLVALLVMSIANIFLGLSILELAICVFGMMIMVGLIAYEISEFEAMNMAPGANTSKLSILISLSLLSKIISIFIYALRFLSVLNIGNRRD